MYIFPYPTIIDRYNNHKHSRGEGSLARSQYCRYVNLHEAIGTVRTQYNADDAH